MHDSVLCSIVFCLTFVGIASEKIHKTVVALLGASLLLIMKIVDQHEAFAEIDLNVIFLLISMMIIVHITSHTGVFQWIAIKIAHIARGKPIQIILLLSLITAVLSAFLDNVTTVILIAPVTLLLAQQLEVNPVPLLILEAVASNIGGTATLIGDPPNLLIGSAAGLSFADFLFNLGPVIVVTMVIFLYTVNVIFAKRMRVSRELRARVLSLDASKAIKDKPLLIKSMAVLSVVFIGFLVHGYFHIEPASISLFGATVLIVITKTDPEEIFKSVEWPTIFFFIGLFILVAGLVKVGVIALVSQKIIELFGNKITVTAMSILWFSALASSIVDNIPYVATLIPIIKEIGPHMATTMGIPYEAVLRPLWWSLALGACLGGNGTIIGASANVIIAGISEKSGYRISFWTFTKYSILFCIQSLIIASIYLYIRYLLFI